MLIVIGQMHAAFHRYFIETANILAKQTVIMKIGHNLLKFDIFTLNDG